MLMSDRTAGSGERVFEAVRLLIALRRYDTYSFECSSVAYTTKPYLHCLRRFQSKTGTSGVFTLRSAPCWWSYFTIERHLKVHMEPLRLELEHILGPRRVRRWQRHIERLVGHIDNIDNRREIVLATVILFVYTFFNPYLGLGVFF